MRREERNRESVKRRNGDTAHASARFAHSRIGRFCSGENVPQFAAFVALTMIKRPYEKGGNALVLGSGVISYITWL
jgi:hypothetical protein